MKTKRFVNPFTRSGKWYKANLHTHTTTSDGVLSPADRVEQYRRAGYDVLALTDHRATNDIRGLSDKKLLVVSGTEFHPRHLAGRGSYHLVALGVPHPFAFADVDDANRCIREVARVGGLSILAHPFWNGISFADFSGLKGLAAIEVYNSTCDRVGRACSESEWAYALEHNLPLPIVGVDDTHRGEAEDVCECWTWLKMPRPTVAGVLRAVGAGACYASCGPKIHDFRVQKGKVRLRCSPVAQIHFMGPPAKGARRRSDGMKRITGFAIDKPEWPYVRAVVTDSRGLRAWTNPIFL